MACAAIASAGRGKMHHPLADKKEAKKIAGQSRFAAYFPGPRPLTKSAVFDFDRLCRLRSMMRGNAS